MCCNQHFLPYVSTNTLSSKKIIAFLMMTLQTINKFLNIQQNIQYLSICQLLEIFCRNEISCRPSIFYGSTQHKLPLFKRTNQM